MLPLPASTFHIQHAIVLLNYLTCNGKADAKSAVEFIPAFVEVEEPVEDARADLRSNADAVVFH